jgi:hypothetical protein
MPPFDEPQKLAHFSAWGIILRYNREPKCRFLIAAASRQLARTRRRAEFAFDGTRPWVVLGKSLPTPQALLFPVLNQSSHSQH